MVYWVIFIVIIILFIILWSAKLDVRMRGVKTTGSISDIRTHTYTDQYGVSHTSYSIVYEFRDEEGIRYTGTKKIGSNRFTLGDSVTVMYLPKNPQRNDADL